MAAVTAAEWMESMVGHIRVGKKVARAENQAVGGAQTVHLCFVLRNRSSQSRTCTRHMQTDTPRRHICCLGGKCRCPNT